MIDEHVFRKAMGNFATGITVVTAKEEQEVRGITVNAFMSLSLDPPLIAISISNKANMQETLQAVDQFAISVLAEEQQELSMIFAKQKQADEAVAFDYLDGTPVIKDALVQLICQTESNVTAGDHTIFIAKVKEIQVTDGKPILYFGGNYQNIK